MSPFPDRLAGGACVLDLDRRVLVAAGRDRLRFLHAVTTARLDDLEPGDGRYGALTDDRGRPVADFHAFALPDAVLLETAGGRLDALAAALGRLVVADDVTLAVAPQALLAVEGPDPEDVAAALGLPGAARPFGPGAGWPADNARAWQAALADPAGEGAEAAAMAARLDGVWLRASRVGGCGLAVLVDPATRAERVGALAAAGVRALGRADSDALAIEAGRIDAPELAAAQVWNELGVMRAIDFAKGCFTGQEILRRVHVLGETRRRLVGLALEAPAGGAGVFDPAAWAGAELADAAGTSAGVLTRAAWSAAAGAPLALALVRREAAAPGTALAARAAAGGASRATPLRAMVIQLPFVRRRAPGAPAPEFEPEEMA